MPSVAIYALATAFAASAYAAPQGSHTDPIIPTSTTAWPSASASSGVKRPDRPYGDWDLQFALMEDLSTTTATYYGDKSYAALGCPNVNDPSGPEAYVPKVADDVQIRAIELDIGYEKDCLLKVWCHDEDINNVTYRVIEDPEGALERAPQPIIDGEEVDGHFYTGLCGDDSQWVSQIRGECKCT